MTIEQHDLEIQINEVTSKMHEEVSICMHALMNDLSILFSQIGLLQKQNCANACPYSDLKENMKRRAEIALQNAKDMQKNWRALKSTKIVRE